MRQGREQYGSLVNLSLVQVSQGWEQDGSNIEGPSLDFNSKVAVDYSDLSLDFV